MTEQTEREVVLVEQALKRLVKRGIAKTKLDSNGNLVYGLTLKGQILRKAQQAMSLLKPLENTD